MVTHRLTRKPDLARLRRIALESQGLTRACPFGRGLSGSRKAIEHIGYVQIDTISVVERAHHHVFRSRVPNFAPTMTQRLLQDHSIFEYWAHAAAYLPMSAYRFSLPYKQAIKGGKVHWYRNRDRKLMQALMDRIRVDGPLRSRDIEEPRGTGAGWWDWKPAKRALEQLYMQGDLMVSARKGFQKTYDLPERVLPREIDTRMPTIVEFASHLLDQQLNCHGFVSLKGITYQRRSQPLRDATRTLVIEGHRAGELEEIQLSDGAKFYCRQGRLEGRLPRTPDRLLILSPFDNAVIQRDRLQNVFGFDYQIECYVPEAKRKWGYFCLPLLFRDTFVGRMDCKAHRSSARLEIRSLHLGLDDFAADTLLAALSDAIRDFARFQSCTRVSLAGVAPARLRGPLTAALANCID